MTREEAIDVLEKMKYPQKVNKNGFVISNVDIENEALDMAIQALSQEPCRYWQNGKCNGNTEVCDDAISRDMALEKMADYVASGYADSAKDFEEYSRIICQLPSVTQKSGNWIEKDGWDGDVYYECSVCGEPFCLIDGTPTDNMYNYCPNCGAKMESEE